MVGDRDGGGGWRGGSCRTIRHVNRAIPIKVDCQRGVRSLKGRRVREGRGRKDGIARIPRSDLKGHRTQGGNGLKELLPRAAQGDAAPFPDGDGAREGRPIVGHGAIGLDGKRAGAIARAAKERLPRGGRAVGQGDRLLF